MPGTNISDKALILRCAPIWNVGDNVAQFLAWADNVERSTQHESAQRVGRALRGLAFTLTTKQTVRPSVRRFLESCRPDQALVWIIQAAEASLTPEDTLAMLNQKYR